jgi:hypothetical protein
VNVVAEDGATWYGGIHSFFFIFPPSPPTPNRFWSTHCSQLPKLQSTKVCDAPIKVFQCILREIFRKTNLTKTTIFEDCLQLPLSSKAFYLYIFNFLAVLGFKLRALLSHTSRPPF